MQITDDQLSSTSFHFQASQNSSHLHTTTKYSSQSFMLSNSSSSTFIYFSFLYYKSHFDILEQCSVDLSLELFLNTSRLKLISGRDSCYSAWMTARGSNLFFECSFQNLLRQLGWTCLVR
jgi:hypothetical protein